MRFLAVVLVVAALASGAGWAALEADAAPNPVATETPGAVTPVLSGRRSPEALLDTRRDQAAAASVSDIGERIPGRGCLVVTQDGRELLLHAPDEPLVPASTQKILVGAALLGVVDPDETFRTTAVAAGAPVDGVLDGDLVIVGGGDPLLSTDAYIARQSDPNKPTTRFADLADAVVAAGITEVRGSVVGDGSRYDDVRSVPSWPQRYLEQVQSGPLSGLGVDDGLESFTPEEVSSYGGRPAADPPAHTASVMTDLLRARGVTVAGAPRSGVAPDGASEIAVLESPPARVVVAQMLRYSDNTTAELLVKEIGVRRGVGGSTTAGLDALTAILVEQGIPVDGLALTDGSGLDPGNRATCRTLTAVLDRSPARDALVEGLAVAGESGTLAGRMVDTPAQGNLRAKTGSLRHVGALAGVVEGADGRTYTFSYVSNVPDGEFLPAAGNELQQEIAVALASVPVAEPPSEVRPVAAAA